MRSFGLGLGLGEASVLSTLSSPLRVDVPLRGLEGLSLDPEKFSIRIEDTSRPNMEYRLERIDGDTATIVIYTRQMITEPLVHFRLQVKWDKSAIARGYDVFIDPPSYQFTAPAQVGAFNTGDVSPVETSETGAGKVPEAVYEPIAVSPPVAVAGVSSGEDTIAEIDIETAEQRRKYGPTIDGNSIWRVARAVATDNKELTIYQWMYGIWKANPQAFTGSNMHRLNMDELLNIPLEREIAEASHSEAWRAYSNQMAMLQPATESGKAAEGDVQRAETFVAVTPEISVESGSVEDSGVAAADESTSRGIQQSTVVFGDESAMGASEGDSPEVSSATTIANLEEVGASIDVDEVEASIATASFISTDVDVFEGNDIILDLLEDADAGNQVDAHSLQPVTSTDEVVQTVTTTAIVPRTDVVSPDKSMSPLESRIEYVNQLPIIGSGAPLAFVGNAWQRADQFISNSPSWATMAFGGWITLVFLMLTQEFRSRRRVTTAAARSRVMDKELRDSKFADLSVAGAQSSAADDPKIESEAVDGNALERTDEHESSGADADIPADPDRTPITRGPDRRYSDRRQKAGPVQPDVIDFNSDEIMEKANSFLESGNSSEAVKLLELTVKLQPDRMNLVLRLLEIYHKLKNAEAFEVLVERFKPALEVMEISKQIDLQLMYSKLCPDSPPLIDPDKATDLDDDTDYGLPANDLATADIEDGIYGFAADQADDPEGAAVEEENYVETQVIVFNNGVALDNDRAATPGAVGEAIDLDVTLQEVDVYLAYGLYDNAEELLHKVKAVYPGRADLMARLLDSYYASKNVVDFESEAEILRSMGDEAEPYWEKVAIMGYELAPYNETFAAGKNKSLGVYELETAKPELPDFNLGAVDEIDLDLDEAEVTLDDADVDLDEAEVALDDAEIVLDEAEIALDDDDVDLDLSEIALDDEEINLDEGAIVIDDDDVTLGEIDIAAALSETNLNLGVETAVIGNVAKNSAETGCDAVAETGRVEAEEGSTDELFENANHDGSDEIVLDAEVDEEIMKFTIPEESENAQNGATLSVNGNEAVALKISVDADDAETAPVDGRVLYFPGGSDEKVSAERFEEFAFDVKMTLQAIRDQLQNMTERQYQQERETHELHKSFVELNDDNSITASSQKKRLR
jgi:FimV-like protein